jgi:hypothetical protein
MSPGHQVLRKRFADAADRSGQYNMHRSTFKYAAKLLFRNPAYCIQNGDSCSQTERTIPE